MHKEGSMHIVIVVVGAFKLEHFFQFPDFVRPQAALCLCANTRVWEIVVQVLTRPLVAGP